VGAYRSSRSQTVGRQIAAALLAVFCLVLAGAFWRNWAAFHVSDMGPATAYGARSYKSGRSYEYQAQVRVDRTGRTYTSEEPKSPNTLYRQLRATGAPSMVLDDVQVNTSISDIYQYRYRGVTHRLGTSQGGFLVAAVIATLAGAAVATGDVLSVRRTRRSGGRLPL
jgi:hypothetical protein